MTRIVVNSYIFVVLKLYTVLIAAFCLNAGPKNPLVIYNTTLIVVKRRMSVVLNIFTSLIAASYYIRKVPKRPLGNYYYH